MTTAFRWFSAAIFALVLVASAAAAETSDLTGTVKDKSGGAVAGAQIIVLTPQRAAVATVTTDQAGKFTVAGLPDGQYLVIVKARGLAERQTAAQVSGSSSSLEVTMEVAPVGDAVTVTASQGSLGDAARTSQPVNFISADQILERAKTVVAQIVDGEPAVNLQRTSPGMAGIYVRGLTGNKVNVFIDGVRYSNGAQRGGVNTFLDLIDPSTLEGVEILRGTSSAQYGSDALGGSLQFLSKVPALSSTDGAKLAGTLTLGAESAHIGGFGNLALTYSRPTFSLGGSVAQRKTGDYKPGGGEDTHAASLRFLGVPSSELYPERMPNTGFSMMGTQLRANWRPSSSTMIVANYLRSRQDGAHRWDQELGGDGNLIAELNDLQLDLAYVRVEKMNAGWFDHLSTTYSFNTQREERVNQGGQGNPTGLITHQPERTTVNGLQFNAGKKLSERQTLLIGADTYLERLTSVAFDFNPVNGTTVLSRPRVPDRATYKQSGIFVQTDISVVPDRLTVQAAVRVGSNRYESNAIDAPVVNGVRLWPDDSLSTTSATYRVGTALRATDSLTFTASVATGYRAPHMTDLGTLGLTGSGFEIASPDIAGLAAFIGTTADGNAVSTGRPVEQVKPETSLNYDGGVRFRNSLARIELNGFSNRIGGNIQKQALILPAGAVGTSVGGQPITSQTAGGAVFVALSTVPVLIRANFDEARIWGVEWLGEFKVTKDATIGSTYTYMRAKDLGTSLPPNIEGGTPAPGGTLWVRYAKSGQKWWVQPYVNAAQEQTQLSTLDQGDRRTGATRTRTQIQNYFRGGATENGWISPGPNGTFSNADDILIATGETLAQVQDRVLGVGVNSAPLWTAVPSYVLYGVRIGITLGRHTFLLDAENLSDQSYRGISWGMDGPGRGVSFRYVGRW